MRTISTPETIRDERASIVIPARTHGQETSDARHPTVRYQDAPQRQGRGEICLSWGQDERGEDEPAAEGDPTKGREANDTGSCRPAQ